MTPGKRWTGREGTKSCGIGGGILPPGKGETIVEKAKALASDMGVDILLMDADMVFGKVHIETAIEHADRAFERGSNVAGTRMMEVMLYASGERQLSAAIEKMGVGRGTRRLAVVVSDSKRLVEVMRALGAKRDDGVLDGRFENLAKFGISRQAVQSVGKEKAMELVLERVAFVDILK